MLPTHVRILSVVANPKLICAHRKYANAHGFSCNHLITPSKRLPNPHYVGHRYTDHDQNMYSRRPTKFDATSISPGKNERVAKYTYENAVRLLLLLFDDANGRINDTHAFVWLSRRTTHYYVHTHKHTKRRQFVET